MMKRDIKALTAQEFDLVIIGGGAFGACAAWDATLRGLSVALVERGDFCQATSSNHFKMVHGGIRYLQHGDVLRIWESKRERQALLRIAPHLVHPLPIAIPTYGHGAKGKALLAAGFGLYDLLTVNRNQGLSDPRQRIPRGRLLSRQECLTLFPDIERQGLTGAGLFYDAQMYNPPRLVLAFLRSAVDAGARIGNYLEATALLRTGERVYGIVAQDRLSGDSVDIRGKVVLNATGPWAERVLSQWLGLALQPPLSFSRDACFVVARPLIGPYALAVSARTSDPDAIFSRSQRHLFLVPWRHATLVGVWHKVYQGKPDAFTVTEAELAEFLDEINAAYAPLNLTLDDVAWWNAGLVLFGDNQSGATNLRYGKRSCLIDHAESHHVQGLITLIGVRATTARGMAEKAIRLVYQKLGYRAPTCRTAITPIDGGQIEQFEPFLKQATQQRPSSLQPEVMRPLIHNYGTAYKRVIHYLNENPVWAERLGKSTTIKAEVVHAVREEMAQKLSDVVFRRTDLGTAGNPGPEALRCGAELMGTEMGWDRQRIEQELTEVCHTYTLMRPGVKVG